MNDWAVATILNQAVDSFNQTIFLNYYSVAPPQTLIEQLWEFDEFKAAVLINRYYLCILVALGVPSTIFALITISKLRLLTSSTLYMAVLSFVDAMVLIFKLTYLILTLRNIRLYDFGCKFMLFTIYYLMHYSNWLLVSMTIERFIAV